MRGKILEGRLQMRCQGSSIGNGSEIEPVIAGTGDYRRAGCQGVARVAMPGLVLLIASCNLLTPFIFVGEHKKKILPEFDKLPGSKVAILVWTDTATLFDYPHARFELATYIADKLSAETSQRKLDVEVVDSRDVEDFIQKSMEAQNDPAAVGRKFNADFVVYLEVLRFQIRDPGESQFLQGRIDASVAVFDLRSDAQRGQRFELTPVQTVYPDKAPVLMSATNSPLVRETTYRKFAEEVARKFYEYSVDL